MNNTLTTAHVPNPYTFYKLQIEDESIVYAFTTDYNLIYNVYFDFSMYQEYIEDYPNLLTHSYGFGFFNNPFIVDKVQKKTKDGRVSTTIHNIILDFLATQNNNTFLLYHCDFKDKKQAFRHKLFKNIVAPTQSYFYHRI